MDWHVRDEAEHCRTWVQEKESEQELKGEKKNWRHWKMATWQETVGGVHTKLFLVHLAAAGGATRKQRQRNLRRRAVARQAREDCS